MIYTSVILTSFSYPWFNFTVVGMVILIKARSRCHRDHQKGNKEEAFSVVIRDVSIFQDYFMENSELCLLKLARKGTETADNGAASMPDAKLSIYFYLAILQRNLIISCLHFHVKNNRSDMYTVGKSDGLLFISHLIWITIFMYTPIVKNIQWFRMQAIKNLIYLVSSIEYGFGFDDNHEVTERNKLLICFAPIAYRISNVSGVVLILRCSMW